MLRCAITLLFVVSYFGQASAQTNPAVDTILYSKILIVPYHPMMHLSDADEQMARDSEKNRE